MNFDQWSKQTRSLSTGYMRLRGYATATGKTNRLDLSYIFPPLLWGRNK